MLKLKFYGLGGQGVVTAAKIFATAVSLYEGKYAITVPSYGYERRGAPVTTSVITDDNKILLNTFVYNPDIVLVIDPRVISRSINISEGIHKETILILNTEDPKVLDTYSKYNFKNIYYANGTKIALEKTGRGIPNTSMLGVLASAGIVTIQSIEKAIKDRFKGKAGDENAEAATEAYRQSKKI